ncbi:hypothetical protein Rhopal_005187-T1 [Rhodotorula paludigena]|uniref:HSF-type DNA-binding domain-containing protein n=1 Tax=Rhodotorula paludigena TaxID=86838 RepID=A0AAV5GS21_9BASI|nr:hypothetical protein Rhopal_005187-T1 [Rhodotorula paludigena]
MTLPSPPIEDQLPHLAQLSAYQSTWSPGEPPAQMQLPERTSYSRPISRDRPSTSPYGSEYSFGAEDLDERAETATPFATKLNYLVNNPDLDEVIRWDASGTAFVFAHSAEALSSALSRVFRHGNTHSFVRQLNIYDFKRLNTVELHNAVESSRPFDSSLTSSDFAGFSHPLFFRETPTRRCDLVALKPKMGKKPSSRNLAAKTATAAADSASRTRTLRTEGKVGGGMKGRKV